MSSEADEKAAAADTERYVVPGLERGLRLLECFSRDRREMTLADLGRELALPRSTVFRLAVTLERMGYLQRVVGGKSYALGSRILTLGFEYLASMDLVEVARPHLTALRDATGAAAHMAIREGREIVYIARVASQAQLASNVHVGTRFQAHATSMGRVLLGALNDSDIVNLYAGVALERFTEFTPGTVPELLDIVEQDRNRGYVVSRFAFERGVASVAAPVRDASGRIVAAINISSPGSYIPLDELDGVIKDRVLESAREISAWLGFRPAALEQRAAGS
ncbi:IclR family transcriptional regulator [Oceanibacterium hippocampi]|uniref:Pca regulon regulatory protein n=1 Tax=Oceanibacterium hippocampi TaxID=745714 RepID=A0A1Y5TGE3_9PROT|nr:IclR family transcriptional regulator [Oceanibacterium hippocampi]SLN63493.1 Pca regulon regulatory protein [Oceanibacterium hippocampi]